MKTRKIISLIMIIMLLVLSIQTGLKAAEGNETTGEGNELNTIVKLKVEAETVEENVAIPIEIYMKNVEHKIYSIDVLIDYNEEFFYELDEDDFETDLDMFLFEYSKEDKNLQIVFNEPINEGKIAKINITPRRTADVTEYDQNIQLLRLYDMYLVTEEYEEDYIEELNSSVWVLGKEIEDPEDPEDPENPENPEDPEDPEEPENGLYLKSKEYKIGKGNINRYEEGDKYISRVEEETTKEEYIEKIETNGEIRIIKADGEELGDGEIIGTGMTIEVTKEEERISLKIAVMGDLDGNGKVTATDLSTLNQTILRLVTLEEEYYIAGDLDENEKITATDLSTENQMLLKLI